LIVVGQSLLPLAAARRLAREVGSPVERIGFTLQPFGFFDVNPSLDVPG